MTDLQLKIAVIEAFLENPEYAFNYLYFESRIGEPRERIRKVMDELRKVNMVVYVKGLMNEEGEVMGSGFELTTRATQWSIREWLVELKNMDSGNTEEVGK